MSNDEGEHLSSEDLSRLAETSLKPDMASGVSGGNGAGKHLLRCRSAAVPGGADQDRRRASSAGGHNDCAAIVECPPDNRVAGTGRGAGRHLGGQAPNTSCRDLRPLRAPVAGCYGGLLFRPVRGGSRVSGAVAVLASAQKKLAAQMARTADAGRRPCVPHT